MVCNNVYKDRDELRSIDNLYIGLKVWKTPELNSICKNCEEVIKETKRIIVGPSLPWYIGNYWNKVHPKILFVGKVLESRSGHDRKCKDADESLDLYNWDTYDYRSPFSKYIQNTAEFLKENGVFKNITSKGCINIEDFIAVTNLVKCGAGKSNINIPFTGKYLASNCLDSLELFDKEVNVLKPDVIIFLTSFFALKSLERKYFNEAQSIKSKHTGGDYWVSYKDDILFISSFHPQGRTKAWQEESWHIYLGSILKYLN